jgi:hypothetical protein
MASGGYLTGSDELGADLAGKQPELEFWNFFRKSNASP